MNNMQKKLKVFFIGEFWYIYMIYLKGYDSFIFSKYEEGVIWLLECLRKGGVEIDYMFVYMV